MGAGWSSLFWFAAIVAAIPAALWLLRRSPIVGSAGGANAMRHIATLPLGAQQRVVTVEVGAGDARRWLVLGVTAQQITALATLEPQADAPVAGTPSPPFAQLLDRLRQGPAR